jgi:hypothetical protein
MHHANRKHVLIEEKPRKIASASLILNESHAGATEEPAGLLDLRGASLQAAAQHFLLLQDKFM